MDCLCVGWRAHWPLGPLWSIKSEQVWLRSHNHEYRLLFSLRPTETTMGIQPWIGQSIISFCLGSLAPRLSQCQGKGEHRPLTQQCGSFVFFLVQVVLYRRNTPRLYYRVHRVHSPSLVRRTYFRVAKCVWPLIMSQCPFTDSGMMR